VVVSVDLILEIQDVKDQSAGHFDIFVVGRHCFETLLGLGPKAADGCFICFKVKTGFVRGDN
jgi:hypothetical protein